MNSQIPFPTFEDFRKLLEFWIDQQDKWFYFEIEAIQSGMVGFEYEQPLGVSWALSNNQKKATQTLQYKQKRVIGKIHDVISHPPSLLLKDAKIFTVNLNLDNDSEKITRTEKRKKYGLVFSQITYYEPIDNIEGFLSNDPRVN